MLEILENQEHIKEWIKGIVVLGLHKDLLLFMLIASITHWS